MQTQTSQSGDIDVDKVEFKIKSNKQDKGEHWVISLTYEGDLSHKSICAK